MKNPMYVKTVLVAAFFMLIAAIALGPNEKTNQKAEADACLQAALNYKPSYQELYYGVTNPNALPECK